MTSAGDEHGGGRTGGGPTIVWFRNDLRMADQPALHAAVERGEPVLCIFILEADNGLRPLGAASRWWLHHSLDGLGADLAKAGAALTLYAGAASDIVPALAEAAGAGALYFTRRYGGSSTALDDAIGTTVASKGCAVETFNGRLLHEPWDIKTKAGGNYNVYTPYWKAAMGLGKPSEPLPTPQHLRGAALPRTGPKPVALDALDLLPTKVNWAAGWDENWTPGEAGAAERLAAFLKEGLAGYPTERDRLASWGTSRLSPHLRFGEVSPRQIHAAVDAAAKPANAVTRDAAGKYMAEIGWREFDYQVLHYHPDIATKNLNAKFDQLPWAEVPKAQLAAWKRGRTGFPVVDAGMRELWATGYMQNRVRMITASFLVKDMLCDWRVGEQWFWDCLCDADPANNTMNWQWVAGTGADASPFFRIFNPVTQGERYDPDGDYIRRHVPELADLKGKAIHAPWLADEADLRRAGVELGRTYPRPILDHNESRQRALTAYQKVRTQSPEKA